MTEVELLDAEEILFNQFKKEYEAVDDFIVGVKAFNLYLMVLEHRQRGD